MATVVGLAVMVAAMTIVKLGVRRVLRRPR